MNSVRDDGNNIHLLAAGYALDALDPAESLQFEQHLTGCESCRADLAEYAAATGRLAAVAEQAPPPGMRAAVLARVAATTQLPPQVGQATEPPPDDATVVVPLRRRRPVGTVLLAAAAAVLAVAVVGVGWRAVTLSGDLDAARTTAAEVAAVVTAPDAESVSGDIPGGARGAVVTSASLDRAVVLADGIQPAPAGKVYQLWFINGAGEATSAGFLTPGPDGRAAQVLAGTSASATTIGVTVEPAGGSPAPTTTPILALQI
jgi:anti-sigma-K factor RskA